MPRTKLVLNGVSGVSGDYLVPPLSVERIAELAAGERGEASRLAWLKKIWSALRNRSFGVPFGDDPAVVASVGWAVLFHKDEDPQVRAAVERLVAHRRGRIPDAARVKVLEYEPPETATEWLARHGVGPGSVLPTKVPYYLLIVGDPARIPFAFGQVLDVDYAVGRLHFEAVAEYERYIDGVIEYETSASVPNGKEAAFFATRHDFDEATQLSADFLVQPLAEGEPPPAQDVGIAQRLGYRMRHVHGDAATRTALQEILASKPPQRPPALLFTATHGVGFPADDARQRAAQGALLCQDWKALGEIRADHYLSADVVPADASLRGMIAFLFGCFSAGTPEEDRFAHENGVTPPQIAGQPFISALAKRLLSHPAGGMLACVGHVERAWGSSIFSPDAGLQLLPFRNAVGRALGGQPLGYAMKDFNERYAALSVSLSADLEQVGFGRIVPPYKLAAQWLERNDAEGYVLIGDPAVQLRAADLA